MRTMLNKRNINFDVKYSSRACLNNSTNKPFSSATFLILTVLRAESNSSNHHGPSFNSFGFPGAGSNDSVLKKNIQIIGELVRRGPRGQLRTRKLRWPSFHMFSTWNGCDAMPQLRTFPLPHLRTAYTTKHKLSSLGMEESAHTCQRNRRSRRVGEGFKSCQRAPA